MSLKPQCLWICNERTSHRAATKYLGSIKTDFFWWTWDRRKTCCIIFLYTSLSAKACKKNNRVWKTCRVLGTFVHNVSEMVCLVFGFLSTSPPCILRGYEHKQKCTNQSEQKIPIQTIAQRGLKSSTEIQTQRNVTAQGKRCSGNKYVPVMT